MVHLTLHPKVKNQKNTTDDALDSTQILHVLERRTSESYMKMIELWPRLLAGP